MEYAMPYHSLKRDLIIGLIFFIFLFMFQKLSYAAPCPKPSKKSSDLATSLKSSTTEAVASVPETPAPTTPVIPSSTVGNAPQTVKLRPEVHAESLDKAIPPIPLEVISPLIRESIITTQAKFEEMPYILVDDPPNNLSGPGDHFYARGIKVPEDAVYVIYKAGLNYTHPVTKEELGFEAVQMGTAQITALGDPSQFKILTIKECIEKDFRLLPAFKAPVETSLVPHPIKIREVGYILSSKTATNNLGKNDVVVISSGLREGVEEGGVLPIYRQNIQVDDKVGGKKNSKKVSLPDKKIGHLLIFKAYEKVSMGLIIEATEVIYLSDKVKSS